MSLHDLMQIKITTADRTEQRISDIPASVVILTRRDIQLHGYTTLSEVLENIPGLYGIDDYSSLGMSFGVRGFWSSFGNTHSVILINGVRQVYDYINSCPLTRIALPVDAIDRIEVVRGPLSVIYGSGAFFGVINIITNEIPDSQAKRDISVAGGSADTYQIDGRLSGSEGRFGYVFHGSYHDTRGIDQPLREMTRNPSGLAPAGISEDYHTGGHLDELEKRFHFSGELDDFRLEMSYAEHEGRSMFLAPPVGGGSLMRQTSTDFALTWRKDLTRRFTGEAKLVYSHTRFMGDLDLFFPDFYGIQQHESRAMDLEVNGFLSVTEDLDVRAGINQRSVLDVYNHFDIASLGQPTLTNNMHTIDPDDDIVTRAVFAQADYDFGQRWRLVAGARLEQAPAYDITMDLAGGTPDFVQVTGRHEDSDIEIVSRLALLAELHPQHVVKLLYGEAITQPSFFAVTRNSLDPDLPDLVGERIRTTELNYLASPGESLSINFSLFRNELENLITRIVEFDGPGSYETWSANAGEMETIGVELSLEGQLRSRLTWKLSGTVQETEDQLNPEIDVAYSPPVLGYARMVFEPRPGVFFAVSGNYVGEMEAYWDETIDNGDGTFGARIGEQVPSYLLVGANVRVENLPYDGLSCSLRFCNLLDTTVRYPTFNNNAWADRGTLGSGRSFLLKFGLTF